MNCLVKRLTHLLMVSYSVSLYSMQSWHDDFRSHSDRLKSLQRRVDSLEMHSGVSYSFVHVDTSVSTGAGFDRGNHPVPPHDTFSEPLTVEQYMQGFAQTWDMDKKQLAALVASKKDLEKAIDQCFLDEQYGKLLLARLDKK